MLELLFIAILLAVAISHHRTKVKVREKLIAEFLFPVSVSRKVREVYPHLTEYQVEVVISGLREFFAITAKSRGRMVAMPSKAVDVAWHEFIVFTRAYQSFCKTALGRFLHHTPAEAMRSPAQDGIKRAWRLSCARAGIDSNNPNRLPLLFAIDQQLEIPDGYKYSLNCHQNGDAFCASDIGCGGGCSGGCGGTSSTGDGDDGCGGDCGGD
jgi:hypothetical protein